MAILQTRIFVKSTEPHETFVETVLGKVIKPVTEEFSADLSWFWFSRYVTEINDSGDCDIAVIPEDYKQSPHPDQPPMHRSVRFRFEISDAEETNFRQRLEEIIQQEEYAISDIRKYNKVEDTGSNRFLGIENRETGRREQRADLVANLYHSISLLMIDSLVGPDDNSRYRLEQTDDLVQNPRGNCFQSMHHLFCNITDVPLDVLVCQREGRVAFGTVQNPPGPLESFDENTLMPIRF